MSTDGSQTDATEGAEAVENPSGSKFGILAMTFGILFASVVVPWGLWFAMGEEEMDAEEHLQLAFEFLENKQYRAAVNLVLPMLNAPNPDPRTGGSVEYVIGMVAYRDAGLMKPPLNKARYEMAISYLKEAHTKSLRTNQIKPWTYTIGLALFKTDRIMEALPHLEEAFQTQGSTSPEICLALADCYLNPNTKLLGVEDISEVDREIEKKKKAERCNQVALKIEGISADYLKKAYRQQIEIAAFKNETEKALKLLKEFREKYTKGKNAYHTPEISELLIVEGKIQIEAERFDDAIETLGELVEEVSLYGQSQSRKAHYLLGLAYESIDDIDNAIKHYKSAESLENSDEALASSLRHADLLRRHKEQHERALDLYSRALNRISNTVDFTNPWISLTKVKQHFQTGWKEWIEEEQFALAIQLSKMLSPLFAKDEAAELTALATSRWAENVQEKYDASTMQEKEKMKPVLYSRWIQAGDAYARLAHTRRTLSNYPDALWDSAHMYRKGHSYKNAYRMLAKFIHLKPSSLLPTAMVMQGEILMDMAAFDEKKDRLDEAVAVFKRVIEQHGKDQVSFTAQINLGKAYLEQNENDLAIKTWKEVLASPTLAPAAREWKQAQFLLGKTLFHLSQQEELAERKARNENRTDDFETISQKRLQLINETVEKLDEYLQRANKGEPTAEAQWLLARALQIKSEFPKREYKLAETDNARLQRQAEIEDALNRSILLFDDLRVKLKPRAGDDQLNELEQKILKDTFFQPCHNLYQLGRFDPTGERYRKAISAYRNAANYYAQDPIVLLSYYQMANCYDQLNSPYEARSQLEQAKVILQQLIKEGFNENSSNYTFKEWQQLLDRAIVIQQAKTNETTIK